MSTTEDTKETPAAEAPREARKTAAKADPAPAAETTAPTPEPQIIPMSQRASNPTTAPEPSPEPAPQLILRVRVLKNGLVISGATAAAGAELNATRQAAEYHADKGEVAILGTL